MTYVLFLIYYFMPLIAWTYAKTKKFDLDSVYCCYITKMLALFTNIIDIALLIYVLAVEKSDDDGRNIAYSSMGVGFAWIVFDMWGLCVYKYLRQERIKEGNTSLS